jgi:hypothetical protein
MRDRERLLREANHRLQVFADSVHDGQRALTPLALLDGALGILASKLSRLRPHREAGQHNQIILGLALGFLKFAITSVGRNGERKSATSKRAKNTIDFMEEK